MHLMLTDLAYTSQALFAQVHKQKYLLKDYTVSITHRECYSLSQLTMNMDINRAQYYIPSSLLSLSTLCSLKMTIVCCLHRKHQFQPAILICNVTHCASGYLSFTLKSAKLTLHIFMDISCMRGCTQTTKELIIPHYFCPLHRPSTSRTGGYGGSFSTGSRGVKRSGKLTPATNTDESYGDDEDQNSCIQISCSELFTLQVVESELLV